MAVAKNKKTSQFTKYIGPVVAAIRELGGSGRPDEVRAVVARNLQMSDAEQSEPLPSGVQTRFENQVHWARFYLAKAGYIDSSQRGVWTLTEKGRLLDVVTPDEIQAMLKEVSAQTKPESEGGYESTPEPDEIAPTISNYRDELARTLQSLPAAGFERFCQRLLRESGFKRSPLLVDRETVESTALASCKSTSWSASRFSSNARNTQAPSARATYVIFVAQ